VGRRCDAGMGKRGSQGPNIGGSGDLGGAQRDKDPGELAGDLGRGVALQRERKGKGEPLTRGPGVAGRARGRWQVGKGDVFWALVVRGECVGRARGAKGGELG
jgi:hypothetical protein